MTEADYAARSNALRQELQRVRDRLDEIAKRKALGVFPASGIEKNLRNEWDDVIQRFRELDDEVWGNNGKDRIKSDIAASYQRGDDRYWIHGYSYAMMREISRELNESIPNMNVSIIEFFGPTQVDACVAIFPSNNLTIPELLEIARQQASKM